MTNSAVLANLFCEVLIERCLTKWKDNNAATDVLCFCRQRTSNSVGLKREERRQKASLTAKQYGHIDSILK